MLLDVRSSLGGAVVMYVCGTCDELEVWCECEETHEPPIVATDDPANSHLAAAIIEPTRGSKRAAVLDLLRAKPGKWIEGYELNVVGGSEARRRARELRQMGHPIETRPAGKGSEWEYRYAT